MDEIEEIEENIKELKKKIKRIDMILPFIYVALGSSLTFLAFILSGILE